MKHCPPFALLSRHSVRVVGASFVAVSEGAVVLEADARVAVTAGRLTAQLPRCARQSHSAHLLDPCHVGWLQWIWLVVAAASEREMHALAASLAGLLRIFVNGVDDGTLWSFHVSVLIDRAPLTMATSSGGEGPMLARRQRERLENLFDHASGGLARSWRGGASGDALLRMIHCRQCRQFLA